MKQAIIVAACVAALALGGCAPGGVTLPLPGGSAVITASDPTIGAVQNSAAKICGFVPTVSTVASIIATFTGGGAIVDLVGRVASSICAEVVPKKTLSRVARPSGPPQVNGVVVQGYFLAK